MTCCLEGEIGPYQHHIVAFSELQHLIRHPKAVFDRGNSCFRGISSTLLSHAVSCNPYTRSCCLGNNKFNVIDRVNVWLIVDNDLDHLCSKVHVLADRLDHLVTCVREQVLRVAEFSPFRLQMILPAKW